MNETRLANQATDRPRRRWLLAAVAGALLTVGLAAGITMAVNHGSKPTANATAPAAQLADVTQACRNWMISSTKAAAAPTWCDDMGTWMNQQTTGSAHMMGSAMWGDADRMRATCRRWLSSTTGTAAGVMPAACDDMVTWMQQRAGANWKGWMTGGQMMGG